MKKLWNMLYAVVFIAIVFFVCRMCKTGCVKVIWYDTDIEEKYRSYWEYSLGDYRFERVVEDDNGAGSGGFSVHKWYKYIFYYADVNGEERCITPSTYCIDDFNEKLLQCVEDVFEEEARLIFMNRTFAEMEGVTAKYNSFYCEAEIIDEKIDLYDSNKGLKFSELNFYNFKENNVKISLSTDVNLDGNVEAYPNLKEKLKEDVDFFFKTYDYTYIKLAFTINSSDDYYNTVYYLEYDGNEYLWSEEYMGDKND